MGSRIPSLGFQDLIEYVCPNSLSLRIRHCTMSLARDKRAYQHADGGFVILQTGTDYMSACSPQHHTRAGVSMVDLWAEIYCNCLSTKVLRSKTLERRMSLLAVSKCVSSAKANEAKAISHQSTT